MGDFAYQWREVLTFTLGPSHHNSCDVYNAPRDHGFLTVSLFGKGWLLVRQPIVNQSMRFCDIDRAMCWIYSSITTQGLIRVPLVSTRDG